MIFLGERIFDASFNVFADNYHSIRPGYPEAMYRDIQSECGITSESRLLEIGAGSGIATTELAKYGCEIIGLEPGANLANIASEHTSDTPNVRIIKGTFEGFQDDNAFDVILALTAFHWINDTEKFQKVRNLLNQNGYMVAVWNSFFQSDKPAMKKVNAVYQDLLPDVYPARENDVNTGVAEKLNRRVLEIQNSDDFYLTFLKRYVVAYNYDKVSYPMLLRTYPKIIKLDENRRETFLKEISKVVEQHGQITVPVQTTLLVCRRKDFFMKSIAS